MMRRAGSLKRSFRGCLGFVLALLFVSWPAAANPILISPDNVLFSFTPHTVLFGFDSDTAISPIVSIAGLPGDRTTGGKRATGGEAGVGSGGASAGSGSGRGFRRPRATANTGQSLRRQPNDSTLAAVDTPPADADANAGATPRVVGPTYTKNVGGGLTTTSYDVDSNLDPLATQMPPSNGTLNTVGLPVFKVSGFGILTVGATHVAFASLTSPAGLDSQVLLINPETGTASLVGDIGPQTTVSDSAAPQIAMPEPATLLLVGAGLLAAVRRRAVR